MSLCASIDNFSRLINCKPLALHFSGHAIKNNKESTSQFGYLGSKSEGDYLIFEENCALK